MLAKFVQELPYIRMKVKNKVVRGGGHIFIISMMAIFVLGLIFLLVFDYKKVVITRERVDDAIVTSLLSSCVYNTEEYGRSGQAVIYRTLTPIRVLPEVMIPVPGKPVAPPYEPLEDPEIFNPDGDEYLNECYALFVQNLRNNLKLDAQMNSMTDGIRGEVEIDNFSVYNVYREFENDVETGFRIVCYTRMSNGEWDAHAYAIDESVEVFSSFDHANVEIEETSVVASLSFSVRSGRYMDGYMPGKTEDDMYVDVSYQRVVDIAIN